MNQSSRTALATTGVAASITSMALGAALAKSLFPLVGPEGVTAFRVGYSALILTCVTRPWRLRTSWPMAANLLVYGIILGLMNLMIYQAFARIPLGVGVAIEVTGPLTVALIGSRKLSDFALIFLAIAGLGLLLPLTGHAADLDPVGLAFAFGAAACWGLYIVVGKRISGLPSGRVVAAGMVAASLFVLPLGVAQAGSALFSTHALLLGLGVALLSSTIPYVVEIAAIRQLPRRVFGVIVSSAPAIGAIIGFIVLDENLSTQQWIAIALIMIATGGSAISASRPQRPKQQDATSPVAPFPVAQQA